MSDRRSDVRLDRVLYARRLSDRACEQLGTGPARAHGLGAPEMTTPARRPNVFLSYAPEEAAHAARLRPHLEISGFAPRLDSEALARDTQWDAALAFTMTSTDFVVALLSRGTRGSRQEQELLCAFRIVAKLGANTSSIFPVLVLPCQNSPGSDQAAIA